MKLKVTYKKLWQKNEPLLYPIRATIKVVDKGDLPSKYMFEFYHSGHPTTDDFNFYFLTWFGGWLENSYNYIQDIFETGCEAETWVKDQIKALEKHRDRWLMDKEDLEGLVVPDNEELEIN